MTIHREGYKSIAIATLIFAAINLSVYFFFSASLMWLCNIIFILTLGLLLFLISFFRIPNRQLTIKDGVIVAPADGKVVVIEETTDVEYFKDKRLQVSIFMSPANVHVNRNPMDGEVVYNQYHKGKYLVAWHPKASTENERTTVVIKRKDGTEVLMRQIAGALAKRICCYSKVGDTAIQGDDMGFIKFGSRVDLYLPLGTNISVSLEQKVQGNIDVIATLNK